MSDPYSDCMDYQINCETALNDFCDSSFISDFLWEVTPEF